MNCLNYPSLILPYLSYPLFFLIFFLLSLPSMTSLFSPSINSFFFSQRSKQFFLFHHSILLLPLFPPLHLLAFCFFVFLGFNYVLKSLQWGLIDLHFCSIAYLSYFLLTEILLLCTELYITYACKCQSGKSLHMAWFAFSPCSLC